MAQTGQEFLELLLLILKAPQRLHAVFVEGAVAARGRTEREAGALHALAHPFPLPLHPLHLVLPAIRMMTPATHFSAPDCVKEKGKSDRPPDHEAENGHRDPAGVPRAFEHARAIGAIGFFHGAAPSI